ncbi:MAG: hypothetical protein COB36_04410 [Alphaproteobacteria bacterium]|nr:MAG: hypothetical protein COB36_04410 [Alphaproteobacteria bacterium]
MIEAVSSSLVNAQALRSNVGSVPPPATVREVPKAPYISPHISIDLAHNKAVLEIRDRDTGDVTQQFPTKSRLVQLSQAQARVDQQQIVRNADIPDAPPPRQEAAVASTPVPVSTIQSSDIVTVQDVTSSTSANVSQSTPQAAAAALSASAQAAQPSTSSAGVSVLA